MIIDYYNVYFDKLVEYLFWIIYIVIDKLWLLINIMIIIIVFVVNYVCQNIFKWWLEYYAYNNKKYKNLPKIIFTLKWNKI